MLNIIPVVGYHGSVNNSPHQEQLLKRDDFVLVVHKGADLIGLARANIVAVDRIAFQF